MTTDGLTPSQVIERGQRAKELFENPTLSAVFEEMLQDCSRAWLATRPLEYDDRTDLYLRAHAIQSLRAKLDEWMSDAIQTAKNLERKERRLREI